MKMNYKEVMGKLFDFDPSTFYTWKKQNRPIIVLIEKYFSKEELEEFLEKGKIDKFEKNNIAFNYIHDLFNRWLVPYESEAFEKIVYFYFEEFASHFCLYDEEGELQDESICYKYNDYASGGVQPIEMFISFIIDYDYNDSVNNILIEYGADDYINIKNYKTKLIYAVSNEITFEEFKFILEYKYQLNMNY